MEQINKTKIEKRLQKKSNTELVRAIIKLKKSNPEVAKELSKPKRKWATINLKELSHVDGDILVAGKVLSAGELEDKKKIVAWCFSEKAKSKIIESKSEAILITDEMKKNPKLNGLAIVR